MAYFGDASAYLSSGNTSMLATGSDSTSSFLSGATSAGDSIGSSFGMLGASKMGLSLISSAFKYSAAAKEAKAKEAYQKYHNSMVQLSAASQQNSVTLNEIMYNEASADQALQIQKGGITSSGTIEASAAAAGVKGNSVYLSMLDVKRNAVQAEYKRAATFKNAMLSFDAQRQNIAFGAVMNRDNSFIPTPNAASYILSGIAGGL